MTWEEYQTILNNHDWTFEMSDDHRVWNRGRYSLNHVLVVKEEMSKIDKNRADEMYTKAMQKGWGR